MTSIHNRALADAIVQKDIEGVRKALQSGADASARINGTTPIHLATMVGSSKLIRSLQEAKADPNGRDSIGRTAIHYAAMGMPDADGDLVQTLIDAGADVNAKDDRDCQPLDLAAGAENTEAAAALTKAGATCKPDRQKWVQQVSASAGRSSARGRS